MRETSLDEFVDRDDGGADGGSEGEATKPGAGVQPEGDLAESGGEPGGIEGGTGDEQDADPGAETEAEPETEPEQTPEPGAGPGSELDAVEPAVSTYDWTPTGADCEACGSAVERRWRDDGRLVCPDCKAW